MGLFLLVSGDFVKTGGMDRANYALASYLARRGDEVHLACYRAADDLRGSPNVVVHEARKPLGSYSLGNPFLKRLGRRWAVRIAARGGRVVVSGGNCPWGDVNYVHHVHAASPTASVGGRPGLERLKRRVDRRIHLAEERATIPRARLVVVGSDKARRDLRDHLPMDGRPIPVVPYGVDPTLFRPASPAERAATRARLGWPQGRPTALFVGALGDRRKGFDVLFRAWEALCRDPSWDADLAVVGRGAELPSWRDRASASGLADRVRFLGGRADLPELMRACDAHVLPSRYEGYSLATVEALCCGLPAFVSASAGVAGRIPEALRELLIPDPEDASDLAARLRRWRARLGRPWPDLEALAEALRSYTWDDMAARIVALIEAEPPGAEQAPG